MVDNGLNWTTKVVVRFLGGHCHEDADWHNGIHKLNYFTE